MPSQSAEDWAEPLLITGPAEAAWVLWTPAFGVQHAGHDGSEDALRAGTVPAVPVPGGWRYPRGAGGETRRDPAAERKDFRKRRRCRGGRLSWIAAPVGRCRPEGAAEDSSLWWSEDREVTAPATDPVSQRRFIV